MAGVAGVAGVASVTSVTTDGDDDDDDDNVLDVFQFQKCTILTLSLSRLMVTPKKCFVLWSIPRRSGHAE